MTAKAYDRVQETTTSTGNGNITLAGAVAGCSTFTSRLAVGDGFFYSIFSAGGTEWEHGYGRLSASTTLVRIAVLESSNADAVVSFSAGTKNVALVQAGVDANAAGMVIFGNGTDGDTTLSSGTLSLTTSVNYRNFTFSSTGLMRNAGTVVGGYILRCSGVLTIASTATQNAGAASGQSQDASTGSTSVAGGAGGPRGIALTGAETGGTVAYVDGGTGGAGGTAAGAAGGTATGGGSGNGGGSGASGSGGLGSSGAGGAGQSANAITKHFDVFHANFDHFFVATTAFQQTNWSGAGGVSADGGGGAGGNGTQHGGGGGGGGSGGGNMCVFARVINRSSSSTFNIQAKGGKGGNGGAGQNTNTGGGGGGAGGGGGWVFIIYEILTGTVITGCLDASGGAGGAGGAATTTGVGGNGGGGGTGGTVTVVDLRSGTITDTAGSAGGAGGAASGVTGGTAGAAGACTVDL